MNTSKLILISLVASATLLTTKEVKPVEKLNAVSSLSLDNKEDSLLNPEAIYFENEKEIDYKSIEILNENKDTNDSDDQCRPRFEWRSPDGCNLRVWVYNPGCNNTRVRFYIKLNSNNLIKCFYLDPGNEMIQDVYDCNGAKFYWGRCPY